MFINNEIKQIEKHISLLNKSDFKTSSKGTYWHLKHLLQVNDNVIYALQKSDPTSYKYKFNLTRAIVFISNRFPRGKGKAPKAVLPSEDISQKELQDLLIILNKKTDGLADLSTNSYFDHKYFGHLNLKRCLKFLKIHTNHHLKIIDDILASQK